MNKKLRVKKNQDFQTIIEHKKYVTSKEFVIYYKQNQLEHMRVGLSVSKKLGNAVTRNKIKRQVREMMKEMFIYNLSFDIIIIVRKYYLYHDFSQNKKILHNLLQKIDFNVKGDSK